MKIGEILDYALPIAAGVFAPELLPALPGWLAAGTAAGGLETLRTGSLAKGLTSGLLAGGTAGILGGLPSGEAAGGVEQLAGPAGDEAAKAGLWDRLTNASASDWYNAAFPKGAGLLSPGGAALGGGLGIMAINANQEMQDRYKQSLADQEAARQARLNQFPQAPVTPYPTYNYLDPYSYLTQGRGGVPFYAAGGYVSGGLASLPGTHPAVKHRRSGSAALRAAYPDKNAAVMAMSDPNSMASKMGIQSQEDPLMRAAYNGRLMQGPGDGTSDSIPAMIDGQHPAALSSGEFVVPAHAVSAIGQGSTHAGAKKLQMMVDRTKKPHAPRLPT